MWLYRRGEREVSLLWKFIIEFFNLFPPAHHKLRRNERSWQFILKFSLLGGMFTTSPTSVDVFIAIVFFSCSARSNEMLEQ